MCLSQKGQDKSLLSAPAGREPSVLPAHPALEKMGKCLRVHSGHLPGLKPSRRECSSFRMFASKFPSSFTPKKPSPVTSYLGLTSVVSLLYPSLSVTLKKSSCLGGVSLRTQLTCRDRAQSTRGKAWFLQLQLEQKVSLHLSWYRSLHRAWQLPIGAPRGKAPEAGFWQPCFRPKWQHYQLMPAAKMHSTHRGEERPCPASWLCLRLRRKRVS